MEMENISDTKKKGNYINMDKKVFKSEYIAPWALPKEEIPITLVWDPTFEYDFIQILVPPEIEVKEFLNVQSYEMSNSSIIIKNLKSPNFFGFVVFSNRIYKEGHKRKEIVVNFVFKGEVKHSRLFTAHIYRPELSLVEPPKNIVLSDDSDPRNLVNLSLKISGFGHIEVITEMNVGGKFLSDLEPLYREMVRDLVATFRMGESHPNKKKEIEINPLYLQQTTKDFIEKMRKGEFPLEIEKEDLEDFREWLNDKENYEKVTKLVSGQLENILIDSLLFYFDSHPTEGVELTGGRPTTIIEKAIQLLRIRFRYKDSLGNEYEPLLVEIPIEDLRQDKNKELKVPINLQWHHEQINPLTEGGRC